MSYIINKYDMVRSSDNWAREHICPKKYQQYTEMSDEEQRELNGWGCGNKFEPIIQFNKADGEHLI